jgi:hypothetical protein
MILTKGGIDRTHISQVIDHVHGDRKKHKQFPYFM